MGLSLKGYSLNDKGDGVKVSWPLSIRVSSCSWTNAAMSSKAAFFFEGIPVSGNPRQDFHEPGRDGCQHG
jgi:hypothetical protein